MFNLQFHKLYPAAWRKPSLAPPSLIRTFAHPHIRTSAYLHICTFVSLIFLASCSLQKHISKTAATNIFTNESFATSHTGISIYEPATGKYWYNYQGDKYFVPASNTKIPTCYAGMKYLGDSLKGILIAETDTAIFVFPTGDPTLLHPDYKKQPVIDLIKTQVKRIYTSQYMWKEEALGSGWSWNDYNESYMAERSPFPVYGNLIKWVQKKENSIEPLTIYSIPEINWEVIFSEENSAETFNVKREIASNTFTLTQGKERLKEQFVPFATHGIRSALELLQDTTGISVILLPDKQVIKQLNNSNLSIKAVKSQPADSLFKPMMHRSDNFFAEQTLLMVSNERLGVMNDSRIIDTLLKTDFKGLPQKPRWVDGSGLSRYNLFTPKDFIWILNNMKSEFGMDRLKTILPTGNEGTLSNYYKPDSSYIFAKTGTLSGVVAISGFLYTSKNKLLIFSVLVNNHQSSSTIIRRAVEKFLQEIRQRY